MEIGQLHHTAGSAGKQPAYRAPEMRGAPRRLDRVAGLSQSTGVYSAGRSLFQIWATIFQLPSSLSVEMVTYLPSSCSGAGAPSTSIV
jgi:hypothetical protein